MKAFLSDRTYFIEEALAMTHEHYEIAIEKWAHGMLGESETADLEAHLDQCEACRAFRSTVLGTEQAMTTTHKPELLDIPWSRVKKRARAWRRRHVLEAAASGLLMLASGVPLVVTTMVRRGGTEAVALLLVIPALFGAYMLRSLFRLVRASKLHEADTRGALELARREIGLAVRETRVYQLCLGAFAFLSFSSPGTALVLIALIVVLEYLRVAPLRRELREME